MCANGTKMHLHSFGVKIAMIRQHTTISLAVICLLPFFWHLMDSRGSSNPTFGWICQYCYEKNLPSIATKRQFLYANISPMRMGRGRNESVCGQGPPLPSLGFLNWKVFCGARKVMKMSLVEGSPFALTAPLREQKWRAIKDILTRLRSITVRGGTWEFRGLGRHW